MSEILFYSIARAGGVTLPPGITDPTSMDYRPLFPARQRRTVKAFGTLRRFAGRQLLQFGRMALRLGQRWATQTGETLPLSQLTTAK